jgi:hypothetical protein
VLVSDLTDKIIADGQAATVRIVYQDARRGVVELDASVEEVENLARRGRKVARRGRRPKSSG